MMPPEILLALGLVFGLPPGGDLLILVPATASEPEAQVLRVQATDPAAPAGVVSYPDAARLLGQSNPRLSDAARQAWDQEFVTASFFSAFAVSKDGGYGYATTANTPAAARDIALQQCLSVNAGCRVIAEIHPQDYTPPPPGALSVSTEIAGYYNDALSQPRHRAMAISEDGAYAMVWGHPTQAAATEAARADCESYRTRDLPGLADYPCVVLPGLE